MGTHMSFKNTVISIFLCYLVSLIFGLFNLFQHDWVTFRSENCGLLETYRTVPLSWDMMDIMDNLAFIPSTILMCASLSFGLFGFGTFVWTTVAISGKRNPKPQEEATFAVFWFLSSALFNVIGQAVWTYEICSGKFAKEYFSDEHCSNFNWNFSYFAGWIATVFLSFCTIGSFVMRRFVCLTFIQF